MTPTLAKATEFSSSAAMVLHELEQSVLAVSQTQSLAAIEAILAARNIFASGAGRSGMAIKMAAMRWMHLGLAVHVVGEITAPAIGPEDLLVLASGSGTTRSAIAAAEVAKAVGAKVLVLTTAPQSRLAQLADSVLTIPAAAKQDYGQDASQQFAGSLFEQSVLLVLDSLFHQMWTRSGETAQQLYTRHANLE